MLAVDQSQESQWIGFQQVASDTGLNDEVALSLNDNLGRQDNFQESDFIYWGVGAGNVTEEMYKNHGVGLVHSIGVAVRSVLYSEDSIDIGGTCVKWSLKDVLPYVPEIPVNWDMWSYKSEFIMHRKSFHSYMSFVRMVLVALECHWDTFKSDTACPIYVEDKYYKPGRCWGFLLERLVNFWVYHSGMRIYKVDPVNGTFTEYFPVSQRNLTRNFSLKKLDSVERSFVSRLSCRAKKYYRDLGGIAWSLFPSGCTSRHSYISLRDW